ncbi:SAM-dependent methyltransferase, partial [Staphylococcus gallinarum]
LKQTGFTKIKTFVDFDINNKDDENGHRLFFIVKK